MILKNSYWYVLEGRMKAMCPDCHSKNPNGWFWNGEKLGYGDYDLNCEICGLPINKRDVKSNDKHEQK